MNRREFLKQGLTASAGLALAGMPKFAGWAHADDPTKWRTFEVITRSKLRTRWGRCAPGCRCRLTSTTDYFKREPR